MKDRLVDTYIDILKLLSADKIHVNAIIKQTSSDRSYIIEKLKKMERFGLIKTVKTEHKQKRFKELTEIGRDFLTVIENSANYIKFYSQLSKAIGDNFSLDDSDKKILSSKLRARNWNNYDIVNYTTLKDSGIDLLSTLGPVEMIFSLLLAFIHLLSRLYSSGNYGAIEILSLIMLSIITRQLDLLRRVDNQIYARGTIPDGFNDSRFDYLANERLGFMDSALDVIAHPDFVEANVLKLDFVRAPFEKIAASIRDTIDLKGKVNYLKNLNGYFEKNTNPELNRREKGSTSTLSL